MTAIFSRNNRPFATLFYEGRHLYSLDGVRANHFLQRGRVDLLLPLRGAFGVGVTGEYFDRRTFYQDAAAHARQLPLPAGARLLHMGAVVNLSMHTWVRGLCLLALAPAMAFAQAAPQAPSSQPAGGASRVWFVAGGAFATMRGDCQTCEEDFPYRHAGAVLVDVGYRANPRMDVGAEVYWMPIDTSQGTIRTTHIDAVAQFRPWASQGFFLKGGAGMAFVRNWVDVLGSDSFNEKALSVIIGAGWAVPADRAPRPAGVRHAARPRHGRLAGQPGADPGRDRQPLVGWGCGGHSIGCRSRKRVPRREPGCPSPPPPRRGISWTRGASCIVAEHDQCSQNPLRALVAYSRTSIVRARDSR